MIGRLFFRQSVRSGGEDSVATAEGLSTSTNRLQNLRTGQTLVATEVDQELVQITVERVNRVDSDEREHGHLTVRSLPQLELLAGNSDGGNGTASGGDGACATKSGQPDHDFVLGVTGGGGAGEKVVGDIGDNGGAGVGPGPSRGERGDRRDGLLADLSDDVGVGLDVSSTGCMLV